MVCVSMGAYVDFLTKLYGKMFIRPTMTQQIIGGYFLEDVIANGGCPLTIKTDYRTENGHDRLKEVLLLWIVCYAFVRVCFIDALWSPAWKWLTSWLSFVMFNSEFVTFPLISWIRCGT